MIDTNKVHCGMTNIIWFRSDLRTRDNPALMAAVSMTKLNKLRAVFYVTEQQWLSHGWGTNKIGFVLQHVMQLQHDLAKLNINLDIEYVSDFNACTQALLHYALKHNASALFYNKEYELNESLRDTKVEHLLSQQQIKIHSFHCQTLITPGVVLTKQQTPYNIFTPFKKACYEILLRSNIQLSSKPRPLPPVTGSSAIVIKNIEPAYQHYLNTPVLKKWQFGEQAALKALQDFCADNILRYHTQRDYPSLDATSKLSAYLAVGAISVKQCFIAAINENKQEFVSGNQGVTTWVNELLWRDFYKNIIVHYPNLCKGHNFNTKYDTLKWLKPQPNLIKWQQGQTGIPIIDAAMQQLVTTGWMHNRLRMIVAMFLTKNLLIDWRHGEQFFSQHLIDLDFASNNGGWQWSASTGTDAVPYFRIFNPITQSERFDPQGEFIRQYCPQLSGLSAKQIHNPSLHLSESQISKLNYVPLIVDISSSRIRAIEHFKSL